MEENQTTGLQTEAQPSTPTTIVPETKAPAAKRWIGFANAPVGTSFAVILTEGEDLPKVLRLAGRADDDAKLKFIQSLGANDSVFVTMGIDDRIALAAYTYGARVARAPSFRLNRQQSIQTVTQIGWDAGEEASGDDESSGDLQARKLRAMALCALGFLWDGKDDTFYPLRKGDLSNLRLRDAYRHYRAMKMNLVASCQRLIASYRDSVILFGARRHAEEAGDLVLKQLISALTGAEASAKEIAAFVAHIGSGDFASIFSKIGKNETLNDKDVAKLVDAFLERNELNIMVTRELSRLKRRLEVMLEGGRDPVYQEIVYEPNPIYTQVLRPNFDGIGPLIAARMIFSISDIRRFPKRMVNEGLMQKLKDERDACRAKLDWESMRGLPEVQRRLALPTTEPIRPGSGQARIREAKIIASVLREQGESEKAALADQIAKSYERGARASHTNAASKLVAFAGYHFHKNGDGKWIRAARRKGQVSNWNTDLKQAVWLWTQGIIKLSTIESVAGENGKKRTTKASLWRQKLDQRRTYELLKLLHAGETKVAELGATLETRLLPTIWQDNVPTGTHQLEWRDYARVSQHLELIYARAGIAPVKGSDDDEGDAPKTIELPEGIQPFGKEMADFIKKHLKGKRKQALDKGCRWLGGTFLRELFHHWHEYVGTANDELAEPMPVDGARGDMPKTEKVKKAKPEAKPKPAPNDSNTPATPKKRGRPPKNPPSQA